jgi:hypothetical protein
MSVLHFSFGFALLEASEAEIVISPRAAMPVLRGHELRGPTAF